MIKLWNKNNFTHLPLWLGHKFETDQDKQQMQTSFLTNLGIKFIQQNYSEANLFSKNMETAGL